MKKLFLSLFFLILSVDGHSKSQFEHYGHKINTSPFVGVDLNRSFAKHSISVEGFDPKFVSASFLENKTSGNSYNFGVNAGYNIVFDDLIYVAPEVFYDHLNNTAVDPYGNTKTDNDRLTSHNQDQMVLNYRYGGKLNLGVVIKNKFNLYAIVGLTNVSYKTNWNSNFGGVFDNQSYGAAKIAPIYGVGASYNLNEKWSVKTSYDHQRFNIRYNYDGWRDRVQLNVFKLAVAYNF